MLHDIEGATLADRPVPTTSGVPRRPTGRFVERDGDLLYEIRHAEAMPAFLLTLVSDTDLWMYLSSRGAFTAGRVEPDRCLFPYETDDRLHMLAGLVGPATLIRLADGGLWRPFDSRPCPNPPEQILRRSPVGDLVELEERHEPTGLRFRVSYALSQTLGLVRRCELHASPDSPPVICEIIDGYLGIMPACVPLGLQQTMSTLVDGYKRTELLYPQGPAIYALESAISDKPEALEALRANLVGHAGLPDAAVAIDPAALQEFEAAAPTPSNPLLLGRPGAYLLRSAMELSPGQCERWAILADAHLDQGQILTAASRLRDGLDPDAIDRYISAGRQRLAALLDDADGAQLTRDEAACAAHRSNTLFNAMRGGVPIDGYTVDPAEFRAFIRSRNRATAHRHEQYFNSLTAPLRLDTLQQGVAAAKDPQLTRLALEYLPLTFARRHGDPSRPWNRFRIQIRGRDGRRVMGYEGNWRDIFQNWEATCRSYPAMLPHVIAKFVNASTPDGHNPYRISERGIDWEIPNPEDPRSNIGYWGDHQLVYLLRLLEQCRDTTPGWLESSLGQRCFSYANIPYRIRPFADIASHPQQSIEFDAAQHKATEAEAARLGADARLVRGPDQQPILVTLLEKLLVTTLAKVSNLVPGGGIWMNTQRPEWNDANNALAGQGLSMVTLCHLRRFCEFVEELIQSADTQTYTVSRAVAHWATTLTPILQSLEANLAEGGCTDDASRWTAMRDLGLAAEQAREALYAGEGWDQASITPDSIRDLLARTRRVCDACLLDAKRDDGLYESYRVLELTDGRAAVRSLGPMLEGQVAALSSGLLNPEQASDLLDALFASSLYRADQRTFMLAPRADLPPFMGRNVIPEPAIAASPALQRALEHTDSSLAYRDDRVNARFAAEIASRDALALRLDQLREDPAWSTTLQADAGAILEAFESTFSHSRFTGRAGRMHKYEGLGSVYWHMVSKLLLAVQECVFEASDRDASPDTLARLRRHYRTIREGLGDRKSPAEFGAVPHEPYSHTPWAAGAQQPGMTGQVKECILARLGELGIRIERGRVRFDPVLIDPAEFLETPAALARTCPANHPLEVPAGALAFTLCSTPVLLRPGPQGLLRIHTQEEGVFEIQTTSLPPHWTRELLGRTGRVTRLEVELAGIQTPHGPEPQAEGPDRTRSNAP